MWRYVSVANDNWIIVMLLLLFVMSSVLQCSRVLTVVLCLYVVLCLH